MSVIGVPEILVLSFMVALAFMVIFPAATICRRLGFSPWLGVLAAVPLANVILLWYVALAQWPRVTTGPQRV